MVTRKLVNLILCGLPIVAIAVVFNVFLSIILRQGSVVADGIVLVKDEWSFSIHAIGSGEFLANVATDKDPFTQVLYFGYRPITGEHVRVWEDYIQNRLDKKYVVFTFVQKLPDVEHVNPVPPEHFMLFDTSDLCNGCEPIIISVGCRGWEITEFGIPADMVISRDNSNGRWMDPFDNRERVTLIIEFDKTFDAKQFPVEEPRECLIN